MQTNAQIDVYRQEEYEFLFRHIEDRKNRELLDGSDLPFNEVVKELFSAKHEITTKLYDYTIGWNLGKVYGWYKQANEWIETTARLQNYLLNRYLYGYTFDESVNQSLQHWFNYGQRSGYEMQLLSDIPYLSFPVRSINNWIDRLQNPAYMRMMSDLLDGVYGQFENEEDPEPNPFLLFQIQNGWIPIGKNWGIRFGNGAFDVLNILTNPYETIKVRGSPMLKGLLSFIENGDLLKAVKTQALTGVLTRSLNTLLPRKTAQNIPVIQDFVSSKPRSIGTTSSVFFDINSYKKYIPYKYRRPNNGRYAKYENIYRDWFNKYGRMRKPKVDPISLVKEIQWRQYVRWRRSNG